MSKISVVGELSLDGSGWDSTLKGAEKGAEHLKGTVEELGRAMGLAFSVGSLVEAGRRTLEFAESIKLGATRLSVTTEEMQRLGFAANQTGVDMGRVEVAFDRLAKAKENALGFGSEGPETTARLAEAFHALGISMADVKSKSPDELFRQIGESIERLGTNSVTTTAAMEIFGRGAGQLIPLLKELREKSELAPLISDKEIENLTIYNQALKEQVVTLQALAAKAIGAGEHPGETMFHFLPGGKVVAAAEQFAEAQDERNAQTRAEIVADIDKRKAAEAAANAAKGPHRNDAKTQAKIDRLTQETVRIRVETEDAALTTEQRITVEKKKQLELAQELKNETDPVKRAQIAKDIALNDQALARDERKEAGGLKHAGEMHALAGDSLTRTGNFLGTSSSSIVSIGRETNTILKEILNVLSGGKGHGHAGGATHGVPGIA